MSNGSISVAELMERGGKRGRSVGVVHGDPGPYRMLFADATLRPSVHSCQTPTGLRAQSPFGVTIAHGFP